MSGDVGGDTATFGGMCDGAAVTGVISEGMVTWVEAIAAWSGALVVPLSFLSGLGDLHQAVILSRLVHWSGGYEGDSWFAVSRRQLSEETGLSSHQIRLATARLVTRGVLETEVRSHNGHQTVHFRLVWAAISGLMGEPCIVKKPQMQGVSIVKKPQMQTPCIVKKPQMQGGALLKNRKCERVSIVKKPQMQTPCIVKKPQMPSGLSNLGSFEYTEMVNTEVEGTSTYDNTPMDSIDSYKESYKESGTLGVKGRKKISSKKESSHRDLVCDGHEKNFELCLSDEPVTPVEMAQQVWRSYSESYRRTYGVDPVRNARVNSQVRQLVSRLGADAIAVAGWFLSHRGSWYVQQGHSVGALLHDCEKLRTEWLTGHSVHHRDASEMDRRSADIAMWNRIAQRFQEKNGG